MSQNNGNPTWSNPATIISFLALLLSIGTNIFQYYNSKAQIEIAKEKSDAEIVSLNAQMEVTKEKSNAEIKSLNAQLEHYKSNAQLIDDVNDELEIVNKDIAIWEQSVFKQTIEVQTAEAELEAAKKSGNNDLIQINQEYIDRIKGTLEYSKSQLEAKKNRRNELENQRQK
jgi:hypothetical protein